MLLNYKKPNTLTLCIPGKGTTVTPIVFLPGIQEIEDAIWKDLKQQKGVKTLIAKGDLVEKAPPAKDNKKGNKGLARYDAEEAAFIIKETYDKRLLTDWLKIEARTVIKTAIEDQLKVVEASLKVKPKDEEDED